MIPLGPYGFPEPPWGNQGAPYFAPGGREVLLYETMTSLHTTYPCGLSSGPLGSPWALGPDTSGGRGPEVTPNGTLQEMTDSKKTQDVAKNDLMYTVDDVPPWYTSVLLGIQHFLTMVGGTISIPYILTPLLCIDDSDPARGKLVCTILFVSGMVTFLQTTVANHPGRYVCLPRAHHAILTTSFEPCNFALHKNMTASEIEEEWQVRMREIQGAIAVASIVQVVIGFTGLMGLLLTWITPLTIVPTVTLVGLSLFQTAADKASGHWGISFLTIALLVLFSQYLKEVPVPIPGYKKGQGCAVSWVYIFKLFPVLLAIILSWGLCGILTAAGTFPAGNRARTDLNLNIINKSPWFRFPYPGQWGLPTASLAGVLGMVAGVVASMIESVGDYYACARIAGAPPPPVHAINRGIGIEGIGCILAGLWGSGNGTTSYSENIGAIGVTKVGSRRVVQVASIIMMVFGVVGKFGAAMVTIPEPVVGGMFIVMFSMITAVGLSTLQFVNLSSSRNLFVIGFSIFFGLALPKWLETHSDSIQTGNVTLDQILSVLLQTSMLIGGILGFVLDNTIPGTPEERGLLEWNAHKNLSSDNPESNPECYDLPFVTETVKRMTWTKYLPFCPNFAGCSVWCRRKPKDIEA
ncbi:Solute carrier family 23 member 1 [Chionoecetes opilio]|uniref:Solute carrier family 23 member 1 n=1 Tax=Chionoecetes opilio TaxID=41210 RepID=A0A8J5CY76_CHIOP|nr:Solute carrier family 23 member 1 [Chionoecetes opilio]